MIQKEYKMGKDRRKQERIRSKEELDRKTLGDEYKTIVEKKHTERNGKKR